MSDEFYDDLPAGGDGDFPGTWKPEAEGDSIAGTITKLRVYPWSDNDGIPERCWVLATDDGEIEVPIKWANLKRLAREQRPAVGDRIKVTYSGEGEKTKAGFNPPKLFDLKVKRGDTPAPPPTPAAPAEAAADDFDF